MSNIQDFPTVYDFDYRGGVDSTGAMLQVWNEDALNNAIKMWLASYTGEVIRRPNAGGFITQMLTSPMNEESADDLEASIRAGLSSDFRPSVIVRNLQVTPIYEKQAWGIYIEVYAPDLGLYVKVSERVRNLV